MGRKREETASGKVIRMHQTCMKLSNSKVNFKKSQKCYNVIFFGGLKEKDP